MDLIDTKEVEEVKFNYYTVVGVASSIINCFVDVKAAIVGVFAGEWARQD